MENRKEQEPAVRTELYSGLGGERIRSILLIISGIILAGGMAAGLLIVQILQAVMRNGSAVPTVVTAAGTAAGILMLYRGVSMLGRIARFKKYLKTLGNRTYCDFTELAAAVGKPVGFIKKDVRRMIRRGWFLEGTTDQKETCLITSRETYRHYEDLRKEIELKKSREEQEAARRADLSEEVREVLDKGDEFLAKIRRSREAVRGGEIYGKIEKMEHVVGRIFERAREHPEIVPDLKKMMDYYLPMTVKLLETYEDMDSQPVQGETIRNSTKEIENTLDTLNSAFARLLDSAFQDAAWDVSSDISVLNTLLAQEGLTGGDFTKTQN